MSKNRIKRTLKYLLGKAYISGRSGQWRYRKYLDGTMEVWYNGNPGGYTVGTQRGNMYAGGWITYNFPVAFDSIPAVTAGVTLGTDAYVVLAQIREADANSVKIRIVAGTSIASNSYYDINIHAFGTWGG